jgi:hypothetical protein
MVGIQRVPAQAFALAWTIFYAILHPFGWRIQRLHFTS